MLPAQLRVEVILEAGQRRVRAAGDRNRRRLVPRGVHLDVVLQRVVIDVIWMAMELSMAGRPTLADGIGTGAIVQSSIGRQMDGRELGTYGVSIAAPTPSRTAPRISFPQNGHAPTFALACGQIKQNKRFDGQ